MKYTHKGWFLFCPIYLNADDGEGMAVDARWAWLDWWFDVNGFIFDLFVTVALFFNPDMEPSFPFMVTGEIKP